MGGVIGGGEELGYGSCGDCGDSTAKVCSTRRSPACMMVSTMKQSEPVVVRDVCDSEGSGAGVLHGGICDGEPWRAVGLL